MRRITSRQNPLVAQFRSAAHGDAGAGMLLDGSHLVSDALAARMPIHHVVVALDALDASDIAPLVTEAAARGIDIVVASAPVMAAISPLRSPSPIAAIGERPTGGARMFEGPASLVAIACDVQDPGNLGAIARVAEAAGAAGMIAAGRGADPFNWKCARGSMGSVLRLPIARAERAETAVADARAHAFRIVAAVPRGGRSLFEADLRGHVAVLVGAEGAGLPDDLVAAADVRVSVPMEAPVESLNTAVTAALLLYEARRQRT